MHPDQTQGKPDQINSRAEKSIIILFLIDYGASPSCNCMIGLTFTTPNGLGNRHTRVFLVPICRHKITKANLRVRQLLTILEDLVSRKHCEK